MFGTLIALFFALLLHFSAIGQEALPNLSIMGLILVAVATLFLFLPPLIIGLSWTPLQRAEQTITPRVFECFLKDRTLKIAAFILLFFPLISYIMAIDVLFLNIFNKNILLPAWIILLGVAIDAVYYMLRRVTTYLDPFQVVNLFAHEANRCIQNDREEDLCNWIEALSEVALRGLQRSSTSICIQVNDELQHILSLFLKSNKSIGHASQDAQSKEAGMGDKISYTLFFLLQRLEMINEKAIEQHLEPVCSNLITILGKITIDAAKYDLSMPSYPLHFLGKFATAAQQHGMTQVGPKAVLTLLEVAKTILNDIDVTYAELQEPFFSLISQMNLISKEMFRQDKGMSIKLLTQPFKDLRELFVSEKMSKHQDTPAILQKIDMVLVEYDALDHVLRTMPPMPPLPPADPTQDFTSLIPDEPLK